jgi:hypothetical protein
MQLVVLWDVAKGFQSADSVVHRLLLIELLIDLPVLIWVVQVHSWGLLYLCKAYRRLDRV